MQDTLLYLTYLGVILLFGILLTVLSNKLRIPNVLLLIFLGVFLNNMNYNGAPLIHFPEVFLISVGVLSLVMIIFDSASKLKLKEFDTLSMSAVKMVGVFSASVLTILSLATILICSVPAYIAVLFASMVTSTAPEVIFAIMKVGRNKVMELLQIEAILNTPVVVLFPFIILEFVRNFQPEMFFSTFIEQLSPFLQQIVAGIGSGMLVGLILLKIMKKQYSEKLIPLIVMVAAILSYILAENLGGNGVIGVTTMALMFGNIKPRERTAMESFSSMFSTALEILVFVLVGFMIKIPLTADFFAASLLLFFIYLVIRLISLQVSFGSEYSFKEKLFMTLNAPQGIATVVVVFMFSTYSIPGVDRILDMVLAFVLYSIILSSVISRFSRFFIKVEAIR